MVEFFLCHFSFSLCAAPRFIHASSLFNFRTVWNSPSNCPRNSALKKKVSLCSLAFLICALLRFLNKVLDTFPQYQQKYSTSCTLTLLKLFVCRARHTEIIMFIIGAFAGRRHLQYYQTEVFSHWNSVVFESEHLLQLLVQNMKTYGIFTLKCLSVTLSSFSLDSIDNSSSWTAEKSSIFTLQFCGWTQVLS
jgi:hypothetical protein